MSRVSTTCKWFNIAKCKQTEQILCKSKLTHSLSSISYVSPGPMRWYSHLLPGGSDHVIGAVHFRRSLSTTEYLIALSSVIVWCTHWRGWVYPVVDMQCRWSDIILFVLALCNLWTHTLQWWGSDVSSLNPDRFLLQHQQWTSCWRSGAQLVWHLPLTLEEWTLLESLESGGSSRWRTIAAIWPWAPLVILRSISKFPVTMTFMPTAILILFNGVSHCRWTFSSLCTIWAGIDVFLADTVSSAVRTNICRPVREH